MVREGLIWFIRGLLQDHRASPTAQSPVPLWVGGADIERENVKASIRLPSSVSLLSLPLLLSVKLLFLDMLCLYHSRFVAACGRRLLTAMVSRGCADHQQC